MKGTTDKFLLHRIFTLKDEEAFEELYHRYATQLRRFIFFKVPTGPDADDLLSTVFLKAWNYMSSNKVDSAGGLLHTIARNVIADFYAARAQNVVGLEEAEIIGDGGDGEYEMTVTTEMRLIRDRLGEMKAEYQEVIVKRYFDKLSIPQIAEHMNKTENNTRVVLHRAIKKLQKILEEENK